MAAKKTPIKTTRRLDPAKCSGKWSVCKGANPRVSAKWGLCEACTTKRAAAMKKAKAAAKAPEAPKVVPIVSRKPVEPKETKTT